LEQEATKCGIQDARVIDFEEFTPEEFKKHKLVIAVVATHYEGDPCDNMRKIFRWMREQRKQKDTESFKGMKFTIFGLGDSSYEQYNEMGKYFNSTFGELGAERVYRYDEADA